MFINTCSTLLPWHTTQVNSSEELDKITSDNMDKLVVVDYSTTWCGPCKLVLPKYEQLAEQYSQSIFLKVREEGVSEGGRRK